ncbi:MAG TPA: hypothetical protein VKY29_00305 [Cryomorphaceae bacterium]|nr:hypothetical protein [Cryomorphaceae bacterium]
MKIFIVSLFALFAVSAGAQQNTDPRLKVKFSEERLSELAKNHPSVIEYWTFYLDNAYVVSTVEPGKNVQDLQTISIDDPNDFNILALDIHPVENASGYYLIEGTDKMLIVHSSEKIAELFNAHRQSNQ